MLIINLSSRIIIVSSNPILSVFKDFFRMILVLIDIFLM